MSVETWKNISVVIVLKMWMWTGYLANFSLDEIEYDNVKEVPVVKNPVVGTPLFDLTTEKVVDTRDSEDDSE